MSLLESKFQADLIKEIKGILPNCIIIKTDPKYIQGFPDLLILNDQKWASLECKRSKKSHRQPNQDFYVNKMNEMSFSSFIYPENKEEVLNDLQQAFGIRRKTCNSKCKSERMVEISRRKTGGSLCKPKNKRKRNSLS